jgi:hypothetical protein
MWDRIMPILIPEEAMVFCTINKDKVLFINKQNILCIGTYLRGSFTESFQIGPSTKELVDHLKFACEQVKTVL